MNEKRPPGQGGRSCFSCRLAKEQQRLEVHKALKASTAGNRSDLRKAGTPIAADPANSLDHAGLKALAKELNRPLFTLEVLRNDPFTAGVPARKAGAEWFAALWQQQIKPGAHLHRIHYILVSQKKPVLMRDGRPYENTRADGEEGEETLRQLEAAHGALPQTVEAITGKGRHVYFRWPSGTEIRNSQLRADVPGLDWRANGGFVLSPPSIHPSGRVYAWSVDSSSEFADAPPWLIEIVTDKRRGDRSTTNNGGEAAAATTTPEAWRSFINEPVDGSRRGKAIARFYGLLVRRYLDPILARDTVRMFNELRCKPPLDDAEVVHITEDISGRELKRRGQ